MIALPEISGIAKVGNSLSVSNGTWKYSPTGYTYRSLLLQRACVQEDRRGHETTHHLLTSAEAGHKLEAKVTASNPAGSKTAMSGKSRTVKR